MRNQTRTWLACCTLLLLWPVLASSAPGWNPAPAMDNPRNEHTSTLLTDGTVLVAAGHGGSGGVVASAERFDPTTNSWTAVGALTTARNYHTATLLRDGSVLVVGGRSGGLGTTSAERYDPATNAWSSAGALTIGRFRHTATLLPDGTVLVAGGDGSGDVSPAERYHPTTNSWTAAGSMSTARYGHTATLLADGTVLIAGGGLGGSGTTTTERYHPSTNTWTAAAPMAVIRTNHTATLLADGTVLVVAGRWNGGRHASAERYSPTTNSWSAAGALTTAQQLHGATLLPDGSVLITGGNGESGVGLATSERYTPSTNSWSAASALATARFSHAATLLADGTLLVTGGNGSGGVRSSAERYDPSTPVWTSASALSGDRQGHTTTLLPDGSVLVAGGRDAAGNVPVAERYDPATDTWSAAGMLVAARYSHTATLLPDGTVLVAGGQVIPAAAIASVERYDPATNTWTALAPMNTARRLLTATLLADGTVLVAGGLVDGGTPSPIVERFDPAANSWTTVGAMASGRLNFTTTLLNDGTVLASGGIGPMGYAQPERFDPATNTWSAAGVPTEMRHYHSATLLADGTVLLAGGSDPIDPSASVERYHPDSNTWTAAAPLTTARHHHTGTLLADGTVLVVGGRSDASPIFASAERYDPATNTWSSAGSMMTARSAHGATLLADGTLLITAGAAGAALASVERYSRELNIDPGRRPVVQTPPANALQLPELTLAGTRFTGDSEASGGGVNNSASNAPVLQLRRLENSQLRWLDATAFTATDYASQALPELHAGWYATTMFVNGIASESRLLSVGGGCPTVVTNGDDSGPGSLRDVLANTCAGSTITFQAGVSTVTLTTAELVVPVNNLTIDGGASGVTITRSTAGGTPDFRLINGSNRSTTLSRLTFSNGNVAGFGGGIFALPGSFTVNDCSFQGNTSIMGSGGQGSAIALAFGTLIVNRSLITGNHGISAVYAQDGNATIDSSTISNNTGIGGGLRFQGDSNRTLVMTNTTISGNTTTGQESAIRLGPSPGVTLSANLINSTITNNTTIDAGWAAITITGGGSATLNLTNTIVSGNLSGGVAADSQATISSGSSNNLIGVGGGLVDGVNGNIVGVTNPLLSALGDFGGGIPTIALLPGSRAINAGTSIGAPVTDQRGESRVGAVDIGAFESGGYTLSLTGGSNQSAAPGQVFADPLLVSVTPNRAGEPVDGGIVNFTPPVAGAGASLAPNPASISGGSASTLATANGTVGSYTVAADTIGSGGGVSFTLSNVAAEISIDDVSITEGDAGSSDAVFTVTRSNDLTAFSVPYSMSAGTAQEGSDYLATSGVLNFAVGGALTQTINVPVVGDLIVEGTETATLVLGVVSNITGATTITNGSGLLTISDNDSAVVAFNPASVSQSEAVTPMVFTVTLSNPVQSGVTVDLNSAFGTATAADFTPIVGGTVTFPANSNASQTVNVTIINDALNEADESYTLTLSGLNAVGSVTLGQAVATGTILDDDPLPVLSINNPSQPEGNFGTTPMNFEITLTPASGRDVSFSRATADGTATVADNDYLPLLPAVVTIPAGQTSATVTVQINGDTDFEGDESFSLNLTEVVNATPGSLTGIGTIEEDDLQPTTTVISSELPDASLVGQPYTVNVSVSAQSQSPLGTVTISDGADSCGLSLSPGALPDSSGSCELTSNSAGAKLLTASYTPASSAFAASSGTASHQVDPASTLISVSGPASSRVNQQISFGFVLDVVAPGGATPSGTVTLSTTGSSCAVTLPSATPACDLQFDGLGPATVSASYTSDDGNHLASTSSGAGNAQTLVFALADLQLTKTAVVGTYLDGDLLVYTITLRNLGEDSAADLLLNDAVPAGLIDLLWTCDSSGGVSCPQNNGSGDLAEAIAVFPVGGLLNYSFYGNVDGSPQQIVNTASVNLPADGRVQDPNLANNSATVVSLFDQLLVDGFEAPLVTAPNGSYMLPASDLRSLLDEVARILFVLDDAHGHAARVYARTHAGQTQFALAARDGAGKLRLGTWQTINGNPQLSWTARESARGWVMEAVDLR